MIKENNMTAIIELNNLSVQFHQKGRLVTAVKDATLHIEKGVFVKTLLTSAHIH